jgi:glycosyltransferase involved in cell wall biosynthesis
MRLDSPSGLAETPLAAPASDAARPRPIAYVIGHLRVGGTQRHLVELLQRLDRSRFAPRVYCLKQRGGMEQSIAHLGVTVTDLGIGESLGAPRSLLRLLAFARHLRREKVALLHCYLPRASIFGVTAGRMARVPAVLVSKRSLQPPRLASRVVDAWADLVLVNSVAVWRHACEMEKCQPAKLCLLVNGIDVKRYGPPSPQGVDGSEPVVGTVLRLEAIKGPDTFIAAARRLAAEMPTVRFVVVGDGSLRARLQRQVVSLGLGDRLQLLGERSDVDALLPTFSVFVLPSVTEGMSMALLEAMAAARPIVATRVGGNVELIRDGETGLLVSSGNADEMAQAIWQLLRQPGWATDLGRAAQRVVVQHHSIERMVERLEAIYDDLLRRKAA